MSVPDRDDTTDYAKRTTVNLAAAAFLLALAIAAVWIFNAMDADEKLRRCLSSGRRDCVALPTGGSVGTIPPNR